MLTIKGVVFLGDCELELVDFRDPTSDPGEIFARDEGLGMCGLRLARLSVAGGKYIAVWRTGAGAQWWAAELSYDDFKAKDKAYYDQGLRSST